MVKHCVVVKKENYFGVFLSIYQIQTKTMSLLTSSLGRFRLVAFVEGISYLLLGITMILKYQYGMPKPNYVVGMLHGGLFILYVILLIQVGVSYKWGLVKMFWGFVASLIPFGTFYADVKLFREKQDLIF
jgi:integral membrane protein